MSHKPNQKKGLSIGAIIPLILLLLLCMPVMAQETRDVCVGCHQGLDGKLGEPVKEWNQSVHREAGVTCKDCHGGNASVAKLAMNKAMGFLGTPQAKEIPALCAKCHADVKKMRPYNLRTDQYAEYQISIHGQRLAKGDSRVATCSSCHGSHEVRKKNDPLSSVYHTKVPETCAKCHSDPKLMEPYKIATDQLSQFQKSYHGQILFGKIPGKNPSLAPNCATCHGIHGATPPGVKEVAAVCGNCHTTIARYFRQGPHEKAVQQTGIPKCITCHGNHDIPYPSLDALTGDQQGHCGSCHDPQSPPYAKAKEMREILQKMAQSIQMNQQAIERLRSKHLEVSELEGKLMEVKGKLTEAKPWTHAVEVKKLAALTDQASKILQGNQKLIARFEKGLEERKKIGVILLSLIGLVIVFLYLKNESMKKRE
jgi:hypothetical protein